MVDQQSTIHLAFMKLSPRSTALVLIDLQKGVMGLQLEPRSGAVILESAIALARRFRAVSAPVVPVHVRFAPDFADAPKQAVAKPFPRPPGGLPPEWSDFVEGLVEPSDIIITKRQWGAFYGTDLDLQLRRRGVRTIVLGGVATNFGVESTARQAFEHGYEVVIAEDLTASLTRELHEFSVREILPRLGFISSASEIEFEVE